VVSRDDADGSCAKERVPSRQQRVCHHQGEHTTVGDPVKSRGVTERKSVTLRGDGVPRKIKRGYTRCVSEESLREG